MIWEELVRKNKEKEGSAPVKAKAEGILWELVTLYPGSEKKKSN